MKRVILPLSLVLCGAVACTPGAFIGSNVLAPSRTPASEVPDVMVGSWRLDGGGVRSAGFYDPGTLEFAEAGGPGQYIALTADGRFESGRVTRTGTGRCAVARYEYHRGTVVVRDSVLVLYATSGRVRNVAPCDLSSDYETNDVRVETVAWRPGITDNSMILAAAALVREMPAAVAIAR